MQVQVAREHGATVADEAQCVQHGQQVEERRVAGVREPRLDRYCIICKQVLPNHIMYHSCYTLQSRKNRFKPLQEKIIWRKTCR